MSIGQEKKPGITLENFSLVIWIKKEITIEKLSYKLRSFNLAMMKKQTNK